VRWMTWQVTSAGPWWWGLSAKRESAVEKAAKIKSADPRWDRNRPLSGMKSRRKGGAGSRSGGQSGGQSGEEGGGARAGGGDGHAPQHAGAYAAVPRPAKQFDSMQLPPPRRDYEPAAAEQRRHGQNQHPSPEHPSTPPLDLPSSRQQHQQKWEQPQQLQQQQQQQQRHRHIPQPLLPPPNTQHQQQQPPPPRSYPNPAASSANYGGGGLGHGNGGGCAMGQGQAGGGRRTPSVTPGGAMRGQPHGRSDSTTPVHGRRSGTPGGGGGVAGFRSSQGYGQPPHMGAGYHQHQHHHPQQGFASNVARYGRRAG